MIQLKEGNSTDVLIDQDFDIAFNFHNFDKAKSKLLKVVYKLALLSDDNSDEIKTKSLSY